MSSKGVLNPGQQAGPVNHFRKTDGYDEGAQGCRLGRSAVRGGGLFGIRRLKETRIGDKFGREGRSKLDKKQSSWLPVPERGGLGVLVGEKEHSSSGGKIRIPNYGQGEGFDSTGGGEKKRVTGRTAVQVGRNSKEVVARPHEPARA